MVKQVLQNVRNFTDSNSSRKFRRFRNNKIRESLNEMACCLKLMKQTKNLNPVSKSICNYNSLRNVIKNCDGDICNYDVSENIGNVNCSNDSSNDRMCYCGNNKSDEDISDALSFCNRNPLRMKVTDCRSQVRFSERKFRNNKTCLYELSTIQSHPDDFKLINFKNSHCCFNRSVGQKFCNENVESNYLNAGYSHKSYHNFSNLINCMKRNKTSDTMFKCKRGMIMKSTLKYHGQRMYNSCKSCYSLNQWTIGDYRGKVNSPLRFESNAEFVSEHMQFGDLNGILNDDSKSKTRSIRPSVKENELSNFYKCYENQIDCCRSYFIDDEKKCVNNRVCSINTRYGKTINYKNGCTKLNNRVTREDTKTKNEITSKKRTFCPPSYFHVSKRFKVDDNKSGVLITGNCLINKVFLNDQNSCRVLELC